MTEEGVLEKLTSFWTNEDYSQFRSGLKTLRNHKTHAEEGSTHSAERLC